MPSDDPRAEGRDWAPTKKIAIHAATDTLQNQIVVPRMSDVPPSLTLDATDQPLSSSLLSISRKSTSLSSQECDQSLVQDSFHSAVSSIDWHYLSPNSAAFLDSRGIHEMHTFQSSPGTSPLDTAARRKVPFLGVSGWAQASLMVVQPSTESEASTLVVHGMHKKFYTAPESGTKCAWRSRCRSCSRRRTCESQCKSISQDTKTDAPDSRQALR